MLLLFIVFWRMKNFLYKQKNKKTSWISWSWFWQLRRHWDFWIIFLNWWNDISSKFQFEEIKRYLVLNQFWNEEKLFFSLWKRSVNDVQIKIRCYETRILWTAKNIKKSSFLIIQNAIYYWNRHQYFDYSI